MAGLSTTDVGGCCCGGSPGCLACSPCQIPRKDLRFSWTNALLGNGSGTLVYSSSPDGWTFVFTGSPWFGNISAILSCVAGSIQVRFHCVIPDPGGSTSDCSYPGSFLLHDYTCNPFHLHLQPNIPCTGACPDFAIYGYTDFYIDDPGPATPCLCTTNLTVHVSGCAGQPLPGAQVTIVCDGGGPTLGPVTTDSSGHAYFGDVPTTTATVTISRDRFNTATFTSQHIRCGIDLFYGMDIYVADGYVCLGLPCAVPTKSVLHISNSIFGDTTVTFDPGVPGWTGVYPDFMGGDCGCTPASVPVYVTFHPGAAGFGPVLSESWPSCNPSIFGACPWLDIPDCIHPESSTIREWISYPVETSYTCPPAFTWTVSGTFSGGCTNPVAGLIGPDQTETITVTE